jgi:pyridoxine kinase
VDLVITGHFSLPEQVDIAAGVLERVRAADRAGAATGKPIVVVDPIMGDRPGGLYVKPEVAEAVAGRLVPLADWITPNLWELGRLAGEDVLGAAGAIRAVRRLGARALVTSVPAGAGEIGLLYVDEADACLFSHPMIPQVPNGTGDLVTACFGAGLVEGLAPLAAAERAARAAAESVKAGDDWHASELPIVALGERLVRPTAEVRIERL